MDNTKVSARQVTNACVRLRPADEVAEGRNHLHRRRMFRESGPGGWGAILVFGEHRKRCPAGAETTNNRMELAAAIEALSALRSLAACCFSAIPSTLSTRSRSGGSTGGAPTDGEERQKPGVKRRPLNVFVFVRHSHVTYAARACRPRLQRTLRQLAVSEAQRYKASLEVET